MKNAIEPIMSKMMSTLSSCAPSARKPRLQLLDQILEQIEDFNFLSQATGELVLCTKDNNAISRNLAYRILNRICQRYIDGEDQFEQDPVLEFIQILLQGNIIQTIISYSLVLGDF